MTESTQNEPPTCILTGAAGENPDDCTTHDHEEHMTEPTQANLERLWKDAEAVRDRLIQAEAQRDQLAEALRDAAGGLEEAAERISRYHAYDGEAIRLQARMARAALKAVGTSA